MVVAARDADVAVAESADTKRREARSRLLQMLRKKRPRRNVSDLARRKLKKQRKKHNNK